MAKIKFNLTQDHIKLIKHLNFKYDDNNLLVWGFNIFYNKYQDIETILKGKIPFDDLINESYEYNDNVIEYYDKLISDIPTVLSIVLQNTTIQPGIYLRLSYENNWSITKTNP